MIDSSNSGQGVCTSITVKETPWAATQQRKISDAFASAGHRTLLRQPYLALRAFGPIPAQSTARRKQGGLVAI